MLLSVCDAVVIIKQLPDANVCKMTLELNDTSLLAKLSSGDMIAMDAVYHKQCLFQ